MRRLIIQALSGENDVYNKWMYLARGPHAAYAARCGADYQFFRGIRDASLPMPSASSWNKVALIREAFTDGYDEVFWLDADTLVVRPDENVFTDAGKYRHSANRHAENDRIQRGDPTSPRAVPHVRMTRQIGTFPEWPWRTDPTTFDLWNPGVILARHTPEAVKCFDWVWEHRHDPLAWYHVDRFWEMNQFNDYFYDHPDMVVDLSDHWNAWYAHCGEPIPEDAAIRAWHGRATSAEAFNEFREWHRKVYG